ncbi:hypothetical protein [Kitasatospora sp. MAP5-34]|uniref:hypothetical protein n=1 Tax=Kitasatospora sp. MAP5-34 TaxID=3035102 RepID=UPI0024740AC9|nr:hypothetical protein [Kitasatospora sp. MAP5-34]MDH6576219.1 hypothetical protein [Kitasatospora sp. MAP5-34]
MDILSAAGGGTGLIALAAVSAYRKSRLAAKARAAASAKPAGPAPRTIDPTLYGLAPRTELVLAGSEHDQEVAAALAAARAGDWRPAAHYLAGGGTDWDLRWSRLGPFNELAVEDDTWLRAWRAEQPENPEAALLHIDALVGLAWKIRSGARASDVSTEQFEGFHRVLRQAEEAAYEAVRLARPGDPNPFVAQIPIAMGLGWSHERFAELWAELTARDPFHWSAHDRALQYWCAKWHGSHELMHRFADHALATAPAGGLLSVHKLQAFYEQFTRDNAEVAEYQRPDVAAALAAVQADLAAADPNHHRVQRSRGWLAFVLAKSGRGAEAVEQFRVLGRFIPMPWLHFHDPVGAYVGHRAGAVLAALDSGALSPR